MVADLASAGSGSGQITEGEPPEPKDGPYVTQVGDVWAYGRHICASSSDRTTMRKTGKGAWLGGRRAEALALEPQSWSRTPPRIDDFSCSHSFL